MTARTLPEIEAALREFSGCREAGQRAFVPSYWGEWAKSGREPRAVRHPADYAGGETLSIVCTQLDLPARQQRQLVQDWCDALPGFTGLRTLWFHSRVPQDLFDAACAVPALEGLWIKWSGIRALDAVGAARSLRYLHIGQSGGIESTAPLAALHTLEWLQLGGTTKCPALDFVAPLTQLRGFVGGDGKALAVPTLEPLAAHTRLEWLQLGAIKVGDGSLAPLGRLLGLRWLGLPNHFALHEFAWLSTRLAHTACDWLAPFACFDRSVFPCPVCRTRCRVMTTGKGSTLLCPVCDNARLARQVLAFEAAAHKAAG